MSIVGLNRLARDLEHTSGLLGDFQTDPAPVLAGYPLTSEERDAVVRKDASWLLAHGMNPVPLRNLMVVLGVAHQDMYGSRDGA